MHTEHLVRRSLSKGLAAKYEFDDLVHASPAMRDVVNIGKQYADTDSAIILEALEQCRFHKNRTAERLGISRTTLWWKIKKLGIDYEIDTSASAWHTLTCNSYARTLIFKWLEINRIWFLV